MRKKQVSPKKESEEGDEEATNRLFGKENSEDDGKKSRLVIPRASIQTVFVTTLVILVLLFNWNQIQKYGGGGDNENNDKHGSEYELAFRDSLGFFDDIPKDHWQRRKHMTLGRVHGPPNEDLEVPEEMLGKRITANFPAHRYITQPAAYYQRYWDPDFVCFHEEKIGNVGDGHKWVCDPHRLGEDCLVYSVGSNGDFSFEVALQKVAPQCEIHIFDPGRFGHLMRLYKLRANYHEWGIQPSGTKQTKAQNTYIGLQAERATDPNQEFKTLLQTVEALGHEGRKVDVFKIDCEGCEWLIYKELLEVDLRQILIEVHDFVPNVITDFFQSLHDAGYVMFHKEPNIQFGGGRCVEFSFLKLAKSFFETDDEVEETE